MNLEEAIKLTKEEWQNNPQLKKDRDEVIQKYGEIFKLENIDNLTAEKFQDFLRFENNKHWTKLDRPGGNLVKNIHKLKSALKILLDETMPISDRIKRIRDKASDDYTPFLANAIYTPILLVTNPKKYPIVNLPVAEALDKLSLYDIKKWNYDEYEWDSVPKMQEIILDVATKNELDLWQIDWVWWKIARNNKNVIEKSISEVDFWLVGSGISRERQDMWNEFRNSEIVGVGWNKTGDISNLSDKEIIEKFNKIQGYDQGVTSLIEFKKIKPKDIVFVNNGKRGFFGIGRVIGKYRFDTKYSINHHVIPVEWITTEYIQYDPVPENPNASVSRIVKNKSELIKLIDNLLDHEEPSSDIEDYAKILEKSKQIIFFGAPGTGKTHHADLLAKFFTKNPVTPKMTFRSAVIKILKEKGAPMHYTDIWKNTSSQNLVETKGKTPAETLLASITADIKINDENSIFRKTDVGTYELNSEKEEELKILENTESEENQFVESVTFHPSYSYEDFIEGIKPSMDKGKISYSLEDGIFKQICEKANADSKNNYVLLIDEINRGNVSKIFGELISILETSYRNKPIKLAYSKKLFSVPKNLFIIGTMNTADRSLVQIDTALRRRFSFIELMPKPEKLINTIDGISLEKLLATLNERIVKVGLREKQVGHTYLLFVKSTSELQFVFSNQIIPLLQDYFFNDYKKLEKKILSQDFVDSDKMIIKEDWKKNTTVFIESLRHTFSL